MCLSDQQLGDTALCQSQHLVELLARESGTLGGPLHLSARQAGLTAARCGAERLVITHFAPTIDRELACAEATAAFGGPVEVAEVGKTWTV